MATNSLRSKPGAGRILLTGATAALFALTATIVVELDPAYATEGTVARVEASDRPSVEATFTRESYRPGDAARLVITDRARGVRLQIVRAGEERHRLGPRDIMAGRAVTPFRTLGSVAGRRVLRIPVGDWPSGLYFARLTARGQRLGHAPFIVRPKRLGEHPVAVVMPTLTWQAYNFRDDDRDGDEDTWYADGDTARIARPFLNRGVPPHYKHYDQPFLRWLSETGRDVDLLAQSDVERTTGRQLAAAYELIVFPGHDEYVTEREYDAIESFRDLGGNLAFLSANNFFYRVTKSGDVMTRARKWRELGRPEASLIGVQFIGNDEGEHRGPWIVRKAGARSWIFAGIDAPVGARFSNGGIEIDKKAPSSPPNTKVLAEIPDLLGPGMTGQMTYYETRAGAKVFAAGAFTLAGSTRQPAVRRLLANLWQRLSAEPSRERRLTAGAGGYGWPVKPFDRQHPVRGFFGDPRIGGQGSKQFHFGVDVSAANGTPVYATITGTVSFLHPDAISVAGSRNVAFEYWHIVPVVRPGQRVQAYETVIGHVEKPWAHVHFSERRNGAYVNPLRAGAMRPNTDETVPEIRAIRIRREGARVTMTAVVVDETPLLVPRPWSNLPVMPALVRWRLVGAGSQPTRWQTVVDFRLRIPPAASFSTVYFASTRQNHANTPGLYELRLADASAQAGRTIEIAASDLSGNTATVRKPLPGER